MVINGMQGRNRGRGRKREKGRKGKKKEEAVPKKKRLKPGETAESTQRWAKRAKSLLLR